MSSVLNERLLRKFYFAIMEDTFGKNVVMKVENGKNSVYDSFNSPINVTLMMREGNNF